MDKQKIILASASPRRNDILNRIGFSGFEIIPADIDETALNKESPSIYAKRMAVEKAAKIYETHKNAVIISGDTVVACGRRILPKTENEDEARMCLKLLSGRRHKIFGGISIIRPDGKQTSRVIQTTVTFKRLTQDDIDLYIASKEWHGKAGGYGIQGFAEIFVKQINGSYSNIVGLCAYNTRQMLRGFCGII